MCSGGMYLFCRRRSGALGGLIAGLVYVYSPYLMYTEPYARGAFPELLALGLFPLLLWRLDALRDKPTATNFALACLMQVALVNAHNLMAVTFTVICLCWLVFETSLQFINREASQMSASDGTLALLALVLGTAAASAFWLPVLLESNSVHLQNLLVPDVLDYRVNFVGLGELLAPPPIHDAGAVNGLRELRQLGIAQVVLACLGAASGFWLYVRGYRTRHPQAFLGLTFFVLLALSLTFLMHPASEALWASVGALQYLQFPWRLLGPLAACLAIAASLSGVWLRRQHIGLIALAVALPIMTVISLLYVPEWRISSLDTSIAARHEMGQKVPSLLGTTATGEYLPRDAHTVPGETRALLDDLADGHPVDRLNRALLPPGARATLVASAPSQRMAHPKRLALRCRSVYLLLAGLARGSEWTGG